MTCLVEVVNQLEAAQRSVAVCTKQMGEVIRQETLDFPRLDQVQNVLMELESGENGDHYLEISINGGSQEMGACKLDIPAGMPYTFFPGSAGSLTVTPSETDPDRISLHIPSGEPTWKIELQQPLEIPRGDPNNVTVGDDEPGGNG